MKGDCNLKGLIKQYRHMLQSSIRANRKSVANFLHTEAKEISAILTEIYFSSYNGDIESKKIAIYDSLHIVAKINLFRDTPSERFILKHTYDSIDTYRIYSEVFRTKIHTSIQDDHAFEKLDCKVFQYFQWLSMMLSTKGRVSQIEVSSVIDRIFIPDVQGV